MNLQILRIAATSLAFLAAAPALAQEVVTTGNDSFDWGWLGLLGLLGLAGLAGRRRNDTHRTTTR